MRDEHRFEIGLGCVCLPLYGKGDEIKSKDAMCVFVLSLSLSNWVVPAAAYKRDRP